MELIINSYNKTKVLETEDKNLNFAEMKVSGSLVRGLCSFNIGFLQKVLVMLSGTHSTFGLMRLDPSRTPVRFQDVESGLIIKIL
jgi:hypothetical protein